MSLLSKFQEKHGYSKTLTEYKSEKIQEEEAKRTEVIIDKDGNKLFMVQAPPDCRFAPETVERQFSHIEGRDFKRCDYDSFSKRISNCWLLKTILSSRSQ